MKSEEKTRLIIGAAMKVHRWFGPGFSEIVYQRALKIELEVLQLRCEAAVVKEIYYANQLIGKKRLDLLVDNEILLELKAIRAIDDSCMNQVLNYLKVFDLEVGLLFNFGKESLEFKRYVL